MSRQERPDQDQKPLSPRQEKYVNGVVKGMMSRAEAARQAGYGKAYSLKAAVRIEQVPAVREAIDAAQSDLRTRTMYDAQEAVKEVDQAIRFAYAQKNPMSIAKLLDLKSRLHGLLVEKHEVVTCDLRKAIQEARERVSTLDAHQLHALGAGNGSAEPGRTETREPNQFADQAAFTD